MLKVRINIPMKNNKMRDIHNIFMVLHQFLPIQKLKQNKQRLTNFEIIFFQLAFDPSFQFSRFYFVIFVQCVFALRMPVLINFSLCFCSSVRFPNVAIFIFDE